MVAAVPTFFVEGVINGTPVMNGSARGTALTMFAVALPVLAVGLVTSTRGSVWGRAALIGALGYLRSVATLLVHATQIQPLLFLAYAALLGLSLWSLVSALLDPRPLLAPDGRLPARGIAAFILTVVALNALASTRYVVPDLGADPPRLPGRDPPDHQPDLRPRPRPIWLPALPRVVTVLLWQRRPPCVLPGRSRPGLLSELEAIGVAVDQWFGHRADPVSDVATLAGAVLFFVLAAATLVPLVLRLRAVPAQTREEGQS